jgi:hypothetical protein
MQLLMHTKIVKLQILMGAKIAQSGYGLGDQGLILDRGQGFFSLCHCMQTSSGAHPASYTVGTRGSFPGGKVARA